MCNAPVGFADVDPVTGNVTFETIVAATEAATFPVRVISVVHLGGRPCGDIVKIHEFAESIGAVVVEDACHALWRNTQTLLGICFQLVVVITRLQQPSVFMPLSILRLAKGCTTDKQ